MTRWTVAAVVALALAMPTPARATGCGRHVFEWFTCRDGAPKEVHTLQNPPEDGGPAAFLRQNRDAGCDVDGQCNGICTFYTPVVPTRLAVGDHLLAGDGESTWCYVCKKPRRARCRKLARSTTTTTTTAPGVTTTTLPCEFSFAGGCWFGGYGNFESCDELCARTGRTCDEATTRDVAGSGGTLANCQTIAAALPGVPLAPGTDADESSCGSPAVGLGCFISATDVAGGSYSLVRVTAPATTCAAFGVGGGCVLHGRRVCACR